MYIMTLSNMTLPNNNTTKAMRHNMIVQYHDICNMTPASWILFKPELTGYERCHTIHYLSWRFIPLPSLQFSFLLVWFLFREWLLPDFILKKKFLVGQPGNWTHNVKITSLALLLNELCGLSAWMIRLAWLYYTGGKGLFISDPAGSGLKLCLFISVWYDRHF